MQVDPPENLDLADFHPSIRAASAGLLRNRYYAQAIFEAFKLVELRVRELSGLELNGQKLMAAALDGNRPIISVASEVGASGRDEQIGFRLMLMGAMTGIRNPKAHELVDQRDPIRTMEYLAFASLLLHRLDGATVERHVQSQG